MLIYGIGVGLFLIFIILLALLKSAKQADEIIERQYKTNKQLSNEKERNKANNK